MTIIRLSEPFQNLKLSRHLQNVNYHVPLLMRSFSDISIKSRLFFFSLKLYYSRNLVTTNVHAVVVVSRVEA